MSNCNDEKKTLHRKKLRLWGKTKNGWTRFWCAKKCAKTSLLNFGLEIFILLLLLVTIQLGIGGDCNCNTSYKYTERTIKVDLDEGKRRFDEPKTDLS